ncbi:MAG: hypothetical protein QXN26_00375 [Thermoplasmataceae archaeon]
MKKLQGHAVARIASVALAVIILAVAGVVLVQPQPRLVKEAYSSYYLQSDLSIMDSLRNNTLYGNNVTLINPGIIYNNITKGIFIELHLEYIPPEGTDSPISYSYSVTLLSTNPSWNKVSYQSTASLNISSKPQKNIMFPVNVSSNVSFGNSINRELGYNSGYSYALLFMATAISAYGTSSSNVTLSLAGVADRISGPFDSPLSGALYKNATIPGKVIIKLPVNYAYLLIAAGIALLIYPATTVKRKKADVVRKFKRDNADNLIEVNVGPSEGAIEISRPEDVFRMAAFVERPVFSHDDIIYIEIDGKTYFAEIKK